MIVAIVPARGGSKRIPKKNVKSFAGHPMIHYSLKAAKDSGLFDRIICSTDDEEIARVAISEGAEVPFIRPEELADDYTPTAPVLLHALEHLEAEGAKVDYLCCIYATAPFIRAEDIRQGLEMLKEKNATSAFSVTTFAFPIFRSLRINEEGRVEMFWPEHELTRSQDLPEAYHDAGQFYWLHIPWFRKEKRTISSDALPVLLPRYLVQDIDTPEDWETAERMFRALERTGQAEITGEGK